MCSENAFTCADSDGRGFPLISKIDYHLTSFVYLEHSQDHDVWKDLDYAGFNGLWNSDVFRSPKIGKLPNNAKVVTGK